MQHFMRRLILLFTLLSFAISAKGQNNSQNEKRTFKNQGEQEDYWAENFFKEKYVAQNYSIFSGDISEIDKNTFKYDTQILVLDNINPKLKSVFTKGILYPQIIGNNASFISGFEELKFLNISPKIKRFRFYLHNKNVMNPTVYLLEITNEQATEKTEIESFIENGTLAFLKSGWIIM